jgi:RND superfamily putative drug exporter
VAAGRRVIRALVWLLMRLRLLVIAAWVAAAVASAAYLPGLAGADEAELGGLVPSHAAALQVERRSLERFRAPLMARTVVVERNARGLTPEEQLAAVRRAVRISRREEPLFHTIRLAVPVPNTAGVFPGARERSTTVVTYLYFEQSATLTARTSLAREYGKRVEHRPETYVGATGAAPARIEQWHAIEDALPLVEIGTILFILLVVGATFRSVGAPLVALGSAAVAYFVSLGVVGWVGERYDIAVPREVEPIMIVLLLGVVTDYAVFFLTSTKRRLQEGMKPVEAVEDAARQNVPIVATTGLIVALGTATLLVGKLEFFRAFGPGAALTVLVALLVSLTLIPAALGVFGRWIFWPSLARPTGEDVEPARRSRVVHALTRRAAAIPIALVASAVLVALTLPLAGTRLGYTLLTGLPKGSDTERALFEASKGFAPGIVAPTEVLVEGEGVGSDRARLVRLQRALEDERGVAGVVGVRRLPPRVAEEVFVRQDAARFGVIWASDPLGGAAVDHVERLRERLPALLEDAGLGGATAGVAGDTALAAETIDLMVSDIVRIAIAALLVNFVFLALFLRSLLAPLLLLLASALALGAALGVTSLVFDELLGYGDLTYYVPFAAAVLLLSLGSDYTLFMVGRIWQESRERPLREGMAIAVPRASRAITVAGIALAGSFALLALVPLRPFREFAVAMSAGILIDTFVVRPLLVPALLGAVGERSRWPQRLRRPAEAPTGS